MIVNNEPFMNNEPAALLTFDLGGGEAAFIKDREIIHPTVAAF